MFFKTNKSEKYIFSPKMNVEGTIFEIFFKPIKNSEKQFWRCRKGFFDEKNHFFERTRLKNATKKKDETKKEKNN